jgi:predicted transcriptional regulator
MLTVDQLLKEKQELLDEIERAEKAKEAAIATAKALQARAKKQLPLIERLIVVAGENAPANGSAPKKRNGSQPQRVLELLREFDEEGIREVGAAELAKGVNISRAAIGHHLRTLAGIGLIKNNGKTSKSKWMLTKKGHDYDYAS